MPERSFEELAYVLKINFNDKIPMLNMFADLNCSPNYYLVPGNYNGNLILGSDLTLTGKRKNKANNWRLESAGKGIYKIVNREDDKKIFECSVSTLELSISNFSGSDNQFWQIDDAHNGLAKISNKKFPNMVLSLTGIPAEGNKAGLINSENGSSFKWKFQEVCEMEQEAFRQHTVPGIIQAEDYDTGCPGDAYYDRDDISEGGQYRTKEGVDIEKCSAGGFNIGWTHAGEWTSYTVNVEKSATYEVSFYIASTYDSAKFHLECDGIDKTGILSVPNTVGFQNWKVIKKNVKLDAGQHVLKLVVDGDFFNIDKIIFEEGE